MHSLNNNIHKIHRLRACRLCKGQSDIQAPLAIPASANGATRGGICRCDVGHQMAQESHGSRVAGNHGQSRDSTTHDAALLAMSWLCKEHRVRAQKSKDSKLGHVKSPLQSLNA